ncbi:MAG TPA: DNA polymerase III subunit gamma/tau [Candidatus Saccharimonadales bacterium]|nr:DNA polymerase III subunit gamma/tau [Candidatus Saccharimonadales bacterium]
MSKALYRKYRSKSLDEVVGQTHVTDILARSIAAGRIAHAYLLTGPRGIGKTSIARILAYEINKLPYDEEATNLDIIEIDAASNNGVEDVRDLREKVQIAPVAATKKIYIIDEVHMLSKAAFNALLKTLEEPPEHAVFILATTDVDKLPSTIISRTQRFSLRAITQKDAVAHLRHIATGENIAIEDSALELIALRGEGSFRDSISLLDQLRGLTDEKTSITRDLVELSLGLAPTELVDQLIDAYTTKDLTKIVTLLDDSEQAGIQTTVLTTQLINAIRGHIAKTPQLMPLLDDLLTVAKSSQPNIKLLTVLASSAVPKPKTAALVAPMPTVSAPIAELERQATRPVSSAQNRETATQTQSSSTLGASPSKPMRNSADKSSKSSKSNANDAPVEYTPGTLDWAKLIDYTRQNFVAINSILSKCTGEMNGETLTLYTQNAFYKKKLDDARIRSSLLTALQATGAGTPLIETIGTPPPPKDSTAAAVAAIMGGGEEVNVSE